MWHPGAFNSVKKEACRRKWILPLLVAALSVGGALPARGGETEKAAVAKIAALRGKTTANEGGKVKSIMLFKLSDDELAQVDFSVFSELETLHVWGPALTDKSLARLEKIPSGLTGVTFALGKFSDKGMTKFLDRQKKLTSLVLVGVPITDDSMTRIGKMDSLLSLGLSKTKVTDKGLACLTSLPDLRLLDLSETCVSDAGLAEVGKLGDLWSLNLNHTKVTDAGMPQLMGLKRLTRLEVESTGVGEKGEAELRKVLPDLKIVR